MKKKPLQVNMHEAKTHLSKLVKQAVNGDEVIIAIAGEPAVRLEPLRKHRRKPVFGAAKGQVWMSDDFDAFDAEIEKMFYGDDRE